MKWCDILSTYLDYSGVAELHEEGGLQQLLPLPLPRLEQAPLHHLL